MTYIVVVVAYVLMLLGISVYKSRTVKSDEDYRHLYILRMV